jgi:hypothetical protein
MMEKKGVEEQSYEVVVREPPHIDQVQVVASGLTLEEANEIRMQTPNSFVRPE